MAIKTIVTRRIESATGFRVGDVRAFLETLPDDSVLLKVKEPMSYPGEQGVTTGYIEATWTESGE